MKERRKPETLRLREISTSFTVDDVEKSVAWYRDVVGFVVQQEWKDDDGNLMGATIQAGSVRLMLGQDDFAKGKDRDKGQGFRLWCITHQDIDELAEAIAARGGQLAREPQDQDWGARDFAVVDPDGFAITISSPIPEA